MARYEIRDAASGELLSRHRTRQGSIDAWRVRHQGRQIQILRTLSNGEHHPVVDGYWHPGADNADQPGVP